MDIAKSEIFSGDVAWSVRITLLKQNCFVVFNLSLLFGFWFFGFSYTIFIYTPLGSGPGGGDDGGIDK